ADMPDAARLPGRRQRLVDAALILRRHVDLVAELAGEGDAHHDRIWTGADRHLACSEEGESIAADVFVERHGLQYLPCLRSGDMQAAIARRQILDLDRAIGGEVLLEPAHVPALHRAGAQHYEPLVAQARDGEV